SWKPKTAPSTAILRSAATGPRVRRRWKTGARRAANTGSCLIKALPAPSTVAGRKSNSRQSTETSISGKGNHNRFPLPQYSLTSRQVFVDGPKRGGSARAPRRIQMPDRCNKFVQGGVFRVGQPEKLGSNKLFTEPNRVPERSSNRVARGR